MQSLYAHLSSIDVKPGDTVQKGQALGRSGMTGLAGGDHLHFTMLVGGHPVNPVEWWDTQWMEDRVLRRSGSVRRLRLRPTEGAGMRIAAAGSGGKPSTPRGAERCVRRHRSRQTEGYNSDGSSSARRPRMMFQPITATRPPHEAAPLEGTPVAVP